MSEQVADISRAAARRLEIDLDAELAMDVEAVSQGGPDRGAPTRYLDPVSLGGLIVSVATLAWTIYKDLKTATTSSTPEVLVRRVRVELHTGTSISVKQRDHVIEVVVNETLAQACRDSTRDSGPT